MKRHRLALALCAVCVAIVPAAHSDDGPKKVALVGKQWHCTGPQDNTQVNVDMAAGTNQDAIHLDAGCTGVIRVGIVTGARDGIKIHAGAHDLEIWGTITCTEKAGIVHQDGVQAMGGTRVTLKWLRIRCPTGNNGGLFVNAGKGQRSVPTDIVCEHCDVFEGNAAIHVGPSSLRSGARDSTLWRGTGRAAPRNCTRIDKGAQEPVNTGNTCQQGPPPAGDGKRP